MLHPVKDCLQTIMTGIIIEDKVLADSSNCLQAQIRKIQNNLIQEFCASML